MGQVQNAVVHQGRDLVAAVLHGHGPSQLQPVHVGAVDLLQRAVRPAVLGPAPVQPVPRRRVAQARIGHRLESVDRPVAEGGTAAGDRVDTGGAGPGVESRFLARNRRPGIRQRVGRSIVVGKQEVDQKSVFRLGQARAARWHGIGVVGQQFLPRTATPPAEKTLTPQRRAVGRTLQGGPMALQAMLFVQCGAGGCRVGWRSCRCVRPDGEAGQGVPEGAPVAFSSARNCS